MSTVVTEKQAQDLLALMHSNKDADAKMAEMQKMKQQIKHNIVQTEGIATLFEAVRLGLVSTNQLLFSHSFSCIGHLIKRVHIQDNNKLRPQAQHLLPIFIDKLGDQKPRVGANAGVLLLDMFKACPQETEKAMKELAMSNKNPRTRENSIAWLRQVFLTSPGFAFRSFTPYLMKMLEDADPAVRDSAKDVVVEMFKNAPDHAKADLKKELVRHNVRKAISSYIVSQLGIPGGEAEAKATGQYSPENEDAPAAKGSGNNKSASVVGGASAGSFIASMPGSELEAIDPEYVNTNRELEEIFQSMVMSFDGRESEANWLAREKNCLRIRKLVRGNAYKDYQQTFLVGVKSLLDGILKAVNSLRTTLSTSGCQLVKDLAIICGPGIDPMVELLLTNTIKQCANTKKITAQQGNLTTAILLANVSYNIRILQHIYGAVQDKNVQPRAFATGWIRLILETHADHKGYLEHTGGVDLLEKSIKRGLADANPGVREGMRGTFWVFAAIWPDRADVIMEGLDNTMKKLLEKENPNAGAAAAGKGASSKAPTLSRTATAPAARSGLKEAILAQKKQAALAKLQRADTQPNFDIAPPPAQSQPAGLQSAPVRPSRPKKPQPEQPARPVIPSGLGSGERATAARAVSPSTTHSSTKESPVHFSRRSPQPSSPPPSLRASRTPARGQTPQAAARKLSLIDQLNHSDWRVRAEGIVVLACILAKKTPPNYEGSKIPTLPPNDILGPTLQKLMNDPQHEVVEHLVAPEVLSELFKVVPIADVATKVLLLSEGDDEDQSQPIIRSTIPALKKLLTVHEAVEVLFTILTNMGGFGTVTGRKGTGQNYTNTQKKRVIHGALIWLEELVQLSVDGMDNYFLMDKNNYKTYANRLITMLSSTKAPNYIPLTKVLQMYRKLDTQVFDKILSTFEAQTVRELKKAWGQPIEEEQRHPVMEERVAHVQEVLGEVPVIPKSRHLSPGPASPRSRKRDFSPRQIQRDFSGSSRSFSGSAPPPTAKIAPQTPPRSKSSDDKENKEANLRTPERNIPSDLASKVAMKLQPQTQPQPTSLFGSQNGEKKPLPSSTVKKQGSNSDMSKGPEHNARTLNTLIQKMKIRDVDTQMLRKICTIIKDVPVRPVLQENNGEDVFDLWDGGRVFDDLMLTTLEFLEDESLGVETSADQRVQGLYILRNLIRVSPYLTRHETAILTVIINARGRYATHSHVTTAIEEIQQSLTTSDPNCIEVVINLLLPADSNEPMAMPTPSWCLGLNCLAKLIRNSTLQNMEKKLPRIAQLVFKSLDAPDAEVRKCCVKMCTEIYRKYGDEQYMFEVVLKGLEVGHQNLLTYYFNKAEDGDD